MHTILIIAGFCAIVLAPVVAAQISRSRKLKHDSSGAVPVARATDPAEPVVIHHLRPRPRQRRF